MPLDEVVIFDADANQVEAPFDDPSTLPYDVVSDIFEFDVIEQVLTAHPWCFKDKRRMLL